MNDYNENKIKPVGEQVVKATVPEKVEVKLVEKKVEKEGKVEKENNTLNIIIGIIIAIGVLFLLFYLVKGIMNKQNKTALGPDNKEYKGEIQANGNTCYDLENYFVVTRDEINEPGENILVKYKTEEKEYSCEYVAEEGDFELKNIRVENTSMNNFAQYYSYLHDDKLIVDSGTGTKRDFRIYDLNTQKIIFTDDYNSGLENLELKENILTYWRTTNDIPNIENCSKIDEYMQMGGAKIEAKITLNINDVSKKEFSEFRCSAIE